ncbi:hypothetical protein [Aliiroseovarius sp. YM-037]|uniref:hypothetical protein n=1 Tax=Aliiroseovarius sp. YM-037 TaxID=3341728 RepID=UPI003A7FDE64
MSGVITWFASLDPRVHQAFVAGAFVAVGWIVNGIGNRHRAAKLRRERLRDVHRALFAEIGAHLANLGDEETLEAHKLAFVERMESDPRFVPFIPHESNDRVYQAIIEDIHILPRTSIDPVVAYYSQLGAISAIVNDMRGEAFKGLSPARRTAVYSDYIEMKKQAFAFGNHALFMIDVFAKKGKKTAQEAAQTKRAGFSNRGADLSGRSQE